MLCFVMTKNSRQTILCLKAAERLQEFLRLLITKKLKTIFIQTVNLYLI